MVPERPASNPIESPGCPKSSQSKILTAGQVCFCVHSTAMCAGVTLGKVDWKTMHDSHSCILSALFPCSEHQQLHQQLQNSLM